MGRGPDKTPRIRRSKKAIASYATNVVIDTDVTRRLIDDAFFKISNPPRPIEYIPLDNPKPTTDPVATNDQELFSIGKKVAAQVMEQCFSEMEKRTDAILDKVRAQTSSRTVAIAIKINDQPIQKLKKEAHPQLADALLILGVGLNPLLVGGAGTGKTYLAGQCAEALNIDFGHLCFSAGVSETWLFGRQTPNGFIEGDFSKLYKNGGLFLADEIDAADPNVLLAINTALANGHLYNPISGEKITRHKSFHFIAAANTVGKGGNSVYTGRSRLDAATLDRFTCIKVGYQDTVEDALCPDQELAVKLRKIRQNLEKRGSQEIVSYRAFDKAMRLKTIGKNTDEILKILSISWPEGLLEDVLS